MTTGSYESRGFRLSFEEAGEGEALLFLHGFPFSRAMWKPQVEAFAGSYRCIVPDLFGFGESEAIPPGGVCRMSDLAADTVALMDLLGIGRAVVCGLSMGGYAALALCEAHPERLRGLVLADTRAGADGPEEAERRIETSRQVLEAGTAFLANSLVSRLLGRSTRERRPDLQEWTAAQIASAPPHGVAAAQLGMAERADRTALLPEIETPTLILVGEEDEVTPPEEAHRMQRAIPGSEIAVIPAAGHLANLEQPEAFNQALRGFLRRLSAGSQGAQGAQGSPGSPGSAG
jgi:pimeloyl-ACP methyl ester carboxylesterase